MGKSREMVRAELHRAASHVRAAQLFLEQPEGCVAMLMELAAARRLARRAAAALTGDCLMSALETAAAGPLGEAEAALLVVEQLGDLIFGGLCPACRREVAKAIRSRRADRT